MTIDTRILVTLACGVGAWLLWRWRSPRPEFPPLETSPDDPLLVEALAKAKSSLGQFLVLVRGPHQHALVKLRFVSSSNQVEHVWAEVVEVLGDDELGVRLATPPVSHKGQLDRLWRCKLDDIEDWQARDPEGRIHGGFSQRAMFAIARRDGVKLPKRLLQIEAEYGETPN